jgi:tRNA A-37 threonylcarbamoyl transferase component Bud32/tetratricopeptide (TPR) repeat protein
MSDGSPPPFGTAGPPHPPQSEVPFEGADEEIRTPTIDISDRITLDSATSSSTTQRMLAPGFRLGRYVILRTIGQGAMGVVYLAHDTELERQIALKLIRPESKIVATLERERLLVEARNIARVHHPNIVVVHDAGEIDGRAFVAMHFVDGESLAAWRAKHDGVAQPKLSWRRIVRAYQQAAAGLAAAHRAGLVHRDFKPENAMIDSGGRVRVLDFGIATAGTRGRTLNEQSTINRLPSDVDQLHTILDRDSHALSTSSVAGTPAYMAPEIYLGQRADARSDQFSFCVALHEALYGRRPFGPRLPTGFALATGQRAHRPAPLIFRAGIPTRLRSILKRGLAADPDLRFRSMDEIEEALADVLGARKRRFMAIAATCTALVGGLLGRTLVASPVHPMCDGAAAADESAWLVANEEAFASQHSNAFDARIIRYFRRYAAQWTDARGKLCRDLDAVDDISRPTEGSEIALKLDCLRDLKDNYTGFREALTSHRRTLAPEQFTLTIENLGDVQSCLRGKFDLVQDRHIHATNPDLRAQLEEEIRDGESKLLFGENEQAIAVADSVAGQIETAIDQPLDLLAISHLLRGRALVRPEHPERAYREIKSAIYSAEEIGSSRIELKSWLALAHAYNVNRRADLAADAADHARALLKRTSLEGTSLEVSLGRVDAFVALTQDKPFAAIERYTAAINLATNLYGADFPVVGELERGIGQAYGHASDTERALDHLDRAAWILSNSGADLNSDYLSTVRLQTFFLCESHRCREAIELISPILDELRRQTPQSMEFARMLACLSRIYYMSEQDEASQLAALEAIKWIEKHAPQRTMLVAELHDRLGASYEELKREDKALYHCQTARDIWKELGTENSTTALSTRVCVAKGLWMTGQLAHAEQEVSSILEQLTLAKNSYSLRISNLALDTRDLIEFITGSKRQNEFREIISQVIDALDVAHSIANGSGTSKTWDAPQTETTVASQAQ